MLPLSADPWGRPRGYDPERTDPGAGWFSATSDTTAGATITIKSTCDGPYCARSPSLAPDEELEAEERDPVWPPDDVEGRSIGSPGWASFVEVQARARSPPRFAV